MNIKEATPLGPHILINTDGACLGNNGSGRGGWAACLRKYDNNNDLVKMKTVTGYQPDTTNNRMELNAAIQALNALGNTRSIPVILYSDSQLLINGMTQWLPNWVANGWRTADKKPVKNVDLWQELEAVASGLDIDWRWVRGHNGDPHNEEVDALANNAAQSCPCF